MRLQKSPIVKTKKTELEKPSKKVVKVLSKAKKKDYKVVSKKGRISATQTPIEISPKKKLIEVYEDHPAFVETIQLGRKEFKVEYEEWDSRKAPYSICKLHDKGNKISFNTSHPLFESKLSNDIIKRLSLGIVLTLKDSPKKEDIIKKLNQLLEDVFLER